MSAGRLARPAPVLIPLVTAGLVPTLLGLLLPGAGLPVTGLPRLIGGGVLVLLGGWMTADSVDRVYLRQRTPLGDRPPEHLVRAGWYRVVRNPMAAGMTLLLIGLALWWSASSVLCWAAVVLTVSCVAVVRVEEPSLLDTFGAQYAAYRREVAGWIPYAPRPRSAKAVPHATDARPNKD
ncbi:PEMT/PEM2 methyltransferase family protein [Streptomyces sp. NPDC005562]|uniref:methyltransferase family protein n=1 Tax=Streptomyces sp. NPDC005562 TaxID=3154890 RepID=UPI00339F0EC1